MGRRRAHRADPTQHGPARLALVVTLAAASVGALVGGLTAASGGPSPRVTTISRGLPLGARAASTGPRTADAASSARGTTSAAGAGSRAAASGRAAAGEAAAGEAAGEAAASAPADGAAAGDAAALDQVGTDSSAPDSSAPEGSGADYLVVGLGDSVPAADACGCTSYVSLVGEQEAGDLGRPYTIDNLAVGGLTTAGLAQQLTQPAVRATIADADLVIVTVGANDFDPAIVTTQACQPASQLPCYQPTLSAQRVGLGSVLTQISQLTAAHGGRVLVTGYWNVFLDGAVGRALGQTYVEVSNALTLAENAVIEDLSTADGETYVDLYAPFKGDGSTDDTGLLAPDGDHPNEAGHQVIARALLAVL